MKVEDIIKSKGNDVHTIHVDAIVSDALRMLNEKRIGSVISLSSTIWGNCWESFPLAMSSRSS